MVIELDKSCKLKAFQKKILTEISNYNKKYLVVCAARQTGKSFILRLSALKWMIENEGCTVGYFSLTNKMCKYFFTLVAKILPKEIIQSCNGSDLTITLTNGSMMRFYTLEPTAVGNIRGTTLDFCIIDEAAFMAEKTPDGQLIYEEIISPMLDVKCKKVVLISTPHGKQGIYYRMVLNCLYHKDKYTFVKNTIEDDETKSKEWIENKRTEMSDKSFRQEYMCEFLDESGDYFNKYSDKFILTKDKLDGTIFAGIDWSSTGADNTILTIMNDKGETLQYLIDGTFDEKYERIGKKLDSYPTIHCIYAEKNSIGAVMINELKKHTKHRSKIKEFNTTNQSKNDIIQALAMDIEQGVLKFEKSNELLQSELSTYTYTINTNGKTIFNARDGFHDDTVMSLAICNYGRHQKKGTGKKIMVVRR